MSGGQRPRCVLGGATRRWTYTYVPVGAPVQFGPIRTSLYSEQRTTQKTVGVASYARPATQRAWAWDNGKETNKPEKARAPPPTCGPVCLPRTSGAREHQRVATVQRRRAGPGTPYEEEKEEDPPAPRVTSWRGKRSDFVRPFARVGRVGSGRDWWR
jgi:hypothetical protein